MVVMSWLLQEGMVAIPRSSKKVRVRENSFARYLDKEKGQYRTFLTRQNLEDIDSLDGNLHMLE